MAMAAMNMVSAGGFWNLCFHLRRCQQGIASVLCKKTPIFGSRRSKLDHMTVFGLQNRNYRVLFHYNPNPSDLQRVVFASICRTSDQARTNRAQIKIQEYTNVTSP
jgi:hypothetical protein